MKIIAIIMLLSAFNVLAEKPIKQQPSKAHLLKVSLAFSDKIQGVFLVTVTNISKETQTVLTNPKRFHGNLSAKDNDGKIIKLYNPEYLGMLCTGFWLEPGNEIKPNETIKWEIPVTSLVYFLRSDDKKVNIKDLRGLTFHANFERLGIQPKKYNVSFSDRNAAQQSNAVIIPNKNG